MAYDLALADRVRSLLTGHKGVTEKEMFGGIAFLVDGKMFCGIIGSDLMARVGSDAHERALAKPHVRIMDFAGRPMRGYVYVSPAAVVTAGQLEQWVSECEVHARTLPQKARKKRASPNATPKARGKRTR
jgi:TfoX/Sxy family transcriptional regulator of competence genes